MPTDTPIIEPFSSHIEGRNATVTIYPDRIKYVRPRGFPMELVAKALPFLGREEEGKIVPIRESSALEQRHDGAFYSVVEVTTTNQSVAMRLGHRFATEVHEEIDQLIRGVHPMQEMAPVGAQDHSNGVIDELERLEALRADGVLTEGEFATQKRRVLGGER
jgi:hypothetical protein